MRFIGRLWWELTHAGKLKASRGLAMLLVVIVLSTLLVVGVLFTTTASLDVQASVYYRQAAQAELFALEGLYRAMAEFYYDVWGVDESLAFRSFDADDPDTTMVIEGGLADAAYYSTLVAPSAGNGDIPGKVLGPWARFRRSVTNIYGGRKYPILTDFRWMIYQADAKSTKIYCGTKDESENVYLHVGTHSGAPYHDEFLPEFTDNSDVWELGVHLNSGDVFGRCYRNDEEKTGGRWSGGSWAGMTKYWPGRRPVREFDYVDTRIVGDSFYKIFRYELIDPATKRSYAAGLDPVTGNYVEPRFTHVGNASEGTYMDSRGEAININQVNNNYQWELYWGGGYTQDTLKMFHYNESKWIYVYNTAGDRMLGRYAVMIWPDCGGPNANMQYDLKEIVSYDWGGTGRHTSDYLKSLDWGFTPHGGPIGGLNSGVINNIISERVEGYESEPFDVGLGTRIGDYKNAVGGFEDTGGGVISSRAEMNMFIRKACFTRAANSGVTDWEEPEAAWDAHIIASLVTVSGYEYLLDHHWANDRLVIDKLGLADGVLSCTYPKTKPVRSITSFHASGQTQLRYLKILNDLKYAWGPDNVKQGKFTQYHDPGNPDKPELTIRSRLTRVTPISWLSHHWLYTRNDFWTQGNRPYGISAENGMISWTDKTTRNKVDTDRWREVCRSDYPVISEVGKYRFKDVDSLPTDSSGRQAWGWGAKYDPTGMGNPDTVYFDGTTPKYFVELVKYWEMDYTNTCMNLDSKYHIYVNGNDILNSTGVTGSTYCRTTRVIGIDNAGGQGGQAYYYEAEKDWTPKVVPSESQFDNSVWAGQAMGGGSGYGGNSMALFCFNKYRNNGQSPWAESWTKAHCGNYLVITFDTTGVMLGAVTAKNGATSIVFTWNDYVMDVAHMPVVGNSLIPSSPLYKYSNVFDCGFDAYDPVNNHSPGNWAPNFLDDPKFGGPDAASPAWRGVSSSAALKWHNKPKVGAYNMNPGQWLDGLNYHHITAYLPGAAHAPSGSESGNVNFTISDVLDSGPHRTGMSIPCGTVACGSQAITCVWGGRSGARDWEGLTKAPTGFWAEWDEVLNKKVPDPFLRFWGDLARVTPLARVMTPGYLGNYGDNIAALGEHSIYDEVDNDMDGRIDNLTGLHIAGGPPGHYFADRKSMGRVNLNEMQHPAAIWYGGFCNGTFSSQTLFVGRKPFKGYTTWFDCLKRGDYYKDSSYGPTVDEPYNMMFWYENMWADCSSDHTHGGRMIEEMAYLDVKDTSRVLFTGNSPVYTVYVTGQVLRDNTDPIAETKLRATIERTWDGKMNILEFSWIPKDIITEQ